MSFAPDSLEIREADLLGRGLRDRSDLCEEDDRDETGDGDGDDSGRETIEASSNIEDCLPWPSGKEATEEAESCSRRGGGEGVGGRGEGVGERGEGVGSTVEAAAPVAGAASEDAAA
jgi:hypothetical protein